MSFASTNKKKTTPLHLLPQANLHVKILDLVSNRINPYKEDLHLQNGDCSTCITTSKKSPHRMSATLKQNNSRKKNISLKTQFQTQAGTNFTTHNNSFYQQPRVSVPYIKSPILVKQTNSCLSINSKVMSISIDSSKLADLTIDLRDQIQPELVSSKFLCKLKLEIIEKQEKIKQLQNELQLKEYHIQQLRKDMQQIIDIHKKQSFSDNRLINNETYNDVYQESTSLKQILMIQRRSSVTKSNSRIKEQRQDFSVYNNDYEYLLRIIKTQAKDIQSFYNADSYSKVRRSISINT